jgi:hypothetical protein
MTAPRIPTEGPAAHSPNEIPDTQPLVAVTEAEEVIGMPAAADGSKVIGAEGSFSVTGPPLDIR